MIKQLNAIAQYSDARVIVQTYEMNPDNEEDLYEFLRNYPFVTGFVLGNEPEPNAETLEKHAVMIESYTSRYPGIKFTIPFANNLLCGGTKVCDDKYPYI